MNTRLFFRVFGILVLEEKVSRCVLPLPEDQRKGERKLFLTSSCTDHGTSSSRARSCRRKNMQSVSHVCSEAHGYTMVCFLSAKSLPPADLRFHIVASGRHLLMIEWLCWLIIVQRDRSNYYITSQGNICQSFLTNELRQPKSTENKCYPRPWWA